MCFCAASRIFDGSFSAALLSGTKSSARFLMHSTTVSTDGSSPRTITGMSWYWPSTFSNRDSLPVACLTPISTASGTWEAMWLSSASPEAQSTRSTSWPSILSGSSRTAPSAAIVHTCSLLSSCSAAILLSFQSLSAAFTRSTARLGLKGLVM